MGERGNIMIGGVWLYTHWRGDRLKEILRNALTRGKGRWHDPSYLTRIIFCDLIEGEERELTGFGISTYMTDNNYPVLVVDIEKQEVREQDVDMDKRKLTKVIGKWTFEKFVEAKA